MELSNKKILVTGASSGIGKIIAIQVSKLGAQLVLTGRDNGRLYDTLKLCEVGNHVIVVADIINEDDINRLVVDVGQIDGAVFCAGVVSYIPVKFLSAEKVDEIFELNFKSQVILTQKLLKQKQINKQGSLVYISSLSSKLGIPGTAMYAASKAALSAFVKVLASEIAGQKIRVNAVSPGIVRTPLFAKSNLSVTHEDFNKNEKSYPLGYGNAENVADYVIFLLSEKSTWITGSDLILDGGFTLS